MGDGDNGAGILVEVLFEPVDRFGVEVVGRLVEQQYVGLLQQQAAQSHTAALTTREGVDDLVVWRALQGVHGAFELGINVPGIGSVELVLKFGLAGDESFHLVGVFKHLGVGESFVYLVEFGQKIHDGLHAFAHYFDHGLFGVELRLLFQIAYRVTGREYHFALIILVDTGNYLEQ